MCSFKVLNTVKDNIYIGIRNADFVWQSVPVHPNHNEFDTCFVESVFIFNHNSFK